jgi:multidrug efflux system outer membrane protein
MRRALSILLAVTLLALSLPALAQSDDASATDDGAGQPVLTLQQVVQAVKDNNPDLAAARARLVAAATGVQQAWSGYLPQASIGATYTRNSVAATLGFPNFSKGFIFDPGPPPTATPKEIDQITVQALDQFGARAQIQQPLFAAPLIPAIMASYKAREIATLSEKEVERALLFGAAEAYYGAAGLREALKLNRQQLVLLREHLRTAQAALAAGSVPELAVLRAKIDVSRAEQDVLRATNAYATARGALATLMGRPDIDFNVAPFVEPKAAAAAPGEVPGLVKDALGSRPDYEAAQLGVDAASLGKKAVWGQFLPMIGLGFNYDYANIKGFTGKNTSWALMVTASIPLFEGGLRFAKLQEADAQITEAQAHVRSLEHQIRQEVRQDALDMASAQASLQKADEQVRLATANWKAVEQSFTVGASSAIDVTDAANALQSAELGRVAEAIQLQVAHLKLRKALGDGTPLAHLALPTKPVEAPPLPAMPTGPAPTPAATPAPKAAPAPAPAK